MHFAHFKAFAHFNNIKKDVHTYLSPTPTPLNKDKKKNNKKQKKKQKKKKQADQNFHFGDNLLTKISLKCFPACTGPSYNIEEMSMRRDVASASLRRCFDVMFLLGY